MTRLCFLAATVFAVSCKPDSPGITTAAFDSVMHQAPGFSGVVLAAGNGKVVYHRAFGFRSYRDSLPMTPDAVFELASLSKQFTAMAVMLLHADGKLSYEDSVGRYIPGFPYHGITIRHLLNHTSGLPDYQAVMDQYWHKTKVATNDDNIGYLKRYRPPAHFTPGEKFEYSNTGYMLLGTIVEAASGMDFIEFSRERIFRPAGMDNADIRTREQKQALPEVAWGHLYVAEAQAYFPADTFPESDYTIWLGGRKGPGRVTATASDLLQWDRALKEGKLLEPSRLAEAYLPARLNNGNTTRYGFGWFLRADGPAGKAAYHTGDNPGYRTFIIRYLEKDKLLVVLNNNEHAKTDMIVHDLAAVLAGQR